MDHRSLLSYWTALDVVTLALTGITGAAVCLAGTRARSGLTLLPILGLYELVASASMFLAALRQVPNHTYWFVWTYAGIGENLLLCFLSIELTASLLPKKQFAQVWCGALAMLTMLSIGSVLPARTDAAIFNATLAGDSIAALVLTVLLFFPGVDISRRSQFNMAGILVPCGIHAAYSFHFLHSELAPVAHYALPLGILTGLVLFIAGSWTGLQTAGMKNGADESAPSHPSTMENGKIFLAAPGLERIQSELMQYEQVATCQRCSSVLVLLGIVSSALQVATCQLAE